MEPRDAIDLAEHDLGTARFDGVCGLYWERSAWFTGAIPSCGRQEVVPLPNVCPVYVCARERGLQHCGVCGEFPCILLVAFAAVGRDDRIHSAELRALIGDVAWREQRRALPVPVRAFCPLHAASPAV